MTFFHPHLSFFFNLLQVKAAQSSLAFFLDAKVLISTDLSSLERAKFTEKVFARYTPHALQFSFFLFSFFFSFFFFSSERSPILIFIARYRNELDFVRETEEALKIVAEESRQAV